MPGPRDKYTARLREALDLAIQEAARFRHAAAGPEHVLLGLLREGTGLATTALANLGVDPDVLCTSVESRLKPGQKVSRSQIEFTAEARNAIDLAAKQAETLGHSYVGQEHLLLALLQSKDGVVADVFAEFDVSYDTARAQIDQILSRRMGKAKLKRYNLALPDEMFREVEQLAEHEHMTVLEVLRRSVKLGLFIAEVQKKPGAALIVRDGKTERQIVLL